jgi:hypothetical protein
MVEPIILNPSQENSKRLKKGSQEAIKKNEAQKEKDLEMVTGIFEYKEQGKRGQTLHFNFGKHSDVLKKYSLKDGGRYRIPRMVAQHLNKKCYYSEYQRLGGKFAGMDAARGVDSTTSTGHEDTYANMYTLNKIHRTAFRSLEFMDDDLYPKTEITEIVYR